MAELQSRLQAAVGDAYRIEKELGGGGMSRVFLAEEVDLGRRVVIKVLPPEMAAGVNQERFHREIQLAANLQHPHIVSLLTAGAQDDLLYYVMPYIKGESLRAKLAREGELPVGETVRILKEVIDALAYAHREGVVHRDIKPDNVLLSEGHAVVTDFGVAKAVTASSGSSSLTSLGVALGTPAYMAPEQAAADPHTDHRADIYAVGTLAYEMLCGEPPFTGPTPQAVMAAHMSDAAEPISNRRSAVSDVLNSVIMRCLEKRAADRWQRAEELLPHLDAILTPTGGVTPTGTAPLPAVDYEAAARQAHPVRVAAMFGAASVVVLGVVYFIMIQLGLPDWVFLGAVALLAIGLPIMLVTGHHERQRALTRTTGVVVTTPASGVRRWFMWRKSLFGGGAAFAGLGVLAAGYMAMRALGIGPAATLMTRGVLTPADTLILVAEFEDQTGDSLLAATVTAALRIDFTQSRVFSLVPPNRIQLALEFMGREEAELRGDVAREVAQRLNLKAMVTGEVGRLGNAYVLSASLVSPETGEVYAAERETADGEDEIVDAVDRLAKGLRERIGESLRTIRASQPLAFATTGSLDALKAYTRHWAAAATGDAERQIALLEEAIALDSTFAVAYRRLGVALANAGLDPARERWAVTKAFEYRRRLTDVERHLVTAYYYHSVDYDPDRTIEEYRSVLDVVPNHGIALNNLMDVYNRQRRWREAEAIGLEFVAHTGITYWTNFANLLDAQLGQGHRADAQETLELLASRTLDDPWLRILRAEASASWGEYEAADAELDQLATLVPEGGAWEMRQLFYRYHLARVRGKLADAERYARAVMALNEDRDVRLYIIWAVNQAIDRQVLRGDTVVARVVVERALERHALDSLHPESRPYLELIQWLTLTGGVAEAGRLAGEYDATVPPGPQKQQPARHAAKAAIARADGRLEEAIAGYRVANAEAFACAYCWLWELGQVYELTGALDSAIAVYERAVATPGRNRLWNESLWKGPALKRLGELHEERGDRDKAVEYYDKFVELWKDADPELQPVVADVRGRIARLVGENR